MDAVRASRGADALRAYVRGDASEPDILSAFREFATDERSLLVNRFRNELDAIDQGRTTILESMLLPWTERTR